MGIKVVPNDRNEPNRGSLAVYEPDSEKLEDDIIEMVPDVTDGHAIYQRPLGVLARDATRGLRIDLTNFITPKRFRFIDCMAFVEDGVLAVWEMRQLPVEQYVAISHVWRSLPPEKDAMLFTQNTFLVDCEDRNDGGPISMAVIYWTSLATLQKGIRWLWLDRLCILQTATEKGRQDKPWQIKQMFRVYRDCAACIVLPAGLRRFTGKTEDTSWMTRAWTFQEVMVPPVIEVLFTVPISSFPTRAVMKMEGVEYFKMVNQSVYDDARDGSAATRAQFSQALEMREYFVEMGRDPNSRIGSLGQFSEIWRFVQWRVSARPVDVVLSVMGLLGVDLEPEHFDKKDRFGATLAMAQQLLHRESSRNTSIEVPLWKWVPSGKWKNAEKLPTDYMRRLPERVSLQNLETELSDQVISRFRSADAHTLAPVNSALGQKTMLNESEVLEKLARRVAIMKSGGDKSDTERIRDWITTHAEVTTKSSQLAERMAEEIPMALKQRALDPREKEKILFKSSENIVTEICRELSNRANLDPASSPSCHVYGWCIRSIFWVKLGRYAEKEASGGRTGSRKSKASVAVPVLTLWKIEVAPSQLE